MTNITIDIVDNAVNAQLQALSRKLGNVEPALTVAAEGLLERTKRRFETSTAPDGAAWKENAPATLGILARSMGKSYKRKNGLPNSKGRAKLGNKKPLYQSGDLKRQITAKASGNSIQMQATMIYAAIQHFGGQAGRGKKVKIPSRPFMPLNPSTNDLYPQERDAIERAISDYLSWDSPA